MSDPDPLGSRFAALRQATIAGTKPPGLDAVRRTVARRSATRILVLALVLLTITGGGLWLMKPTGRHRPTVTTSVTPSPWSAPTTPVPSASSTSGAPSSPPPSAGRHPTGPATTPNACSTPPDIVGYETLSVNPPSYFAPCPTARFRVYGVTYEWDVNRQQYTLAHLHNSYLTAASPSITRPTAEVDPIGNACGYVFVIAMSPVDPPSALPVAATDAGDLQYWSTHKLGLALGQLWDTSKVTTLAQMPPCRAGGSPSTS